ncbi:hypothetical protein BH11PLA2_BH11PLA2_34490 [soil metagenome]
MRWLSNVVSLLGNVLLAALVIAAVVMVGVGISHGSELAWFQGAAKPELDLFAVEPIAVSAESRRRVDLDLFVPVSKKRGEPAKAKKIVYVYGDLQTCTGCIKTHTEWTELPAEQRNALPYSLVFKAPPGWERSWPTFHWQDTKGVWRQFDLYGIDNPKSMLAEFARSYKATEKAG